MPFASTILMVRPGCFGYNEQTAVNNSFQRYLSLTNVQQKALEEFDAMVAIISNAGIDVMVIDDTPVPAKPDAIFPNNWFCTLPGGLLATFPMFAPNRRTERRKDIIDQLLQRFSVTAYEDLAAHEEQDLFLEGTGSMVMDHSNRIIYACTSERTHPLLLEQFGERVGYEVVSFTANDKNGLPVYHTNVMMCLGNGFCIACDDVIAAADKTLFTRSLDKTNTKDISISYKQMQQFAGNMLQLQNKKGEHYLVMSASAFNALTPQQKEWLHQHTQLLPVNISTIETIGGGSARCMMAEIFLHPKQ